MSQVALEPVRRPRFSRAAPPAFQITERDVEIVRQVARHRFLRSTHISQLLDASHKKILERLSPLYHAGYLDRPRAQLEYHVRGGGSAPLVYALGNRGAQLLAARDGYGAADVDWAYKNSETGREFILHTLAIADVRVALAVACHRHGGISLIHQDQLLESLPAETRAARNPWAWRVRAPHNGGFAEIGILPDIVFALKFPDGRRRAFFVECDRGTMPVERSNLDQTSMVRKFLAYEATRKQGLHSQRFGWKAFRTLIITSNTDRITNMRAVIQRTPAIAGSPLFLFADHAALLDSDILAHGWRDATGKLHNLV
jgi:Replication-relaxation